MSLLAVLICLLQFIATTAVYAVALRTPHRGRHRITRTTPVQHYATSR